MSPGISTGWPVDAAPRQGGMPGAKARVAPLRCTQTRRCGRPRCASSNLAMLCATS